MKVRQGPDCSDNCPTMRTMKKTVKVSFLRVCLIRIVKVIGFAGIRAFDIIVYRDAPFRKMAASDEMPFAPDPSPGHLSYRKTTACQIRSLAKKPRQLAAVSPAHLRNMPMTDADNSRELPDAFYLFLIQRTACTQTCRMRTTIEKNAPCTKRSERCHNEQQRHYGNVHGHDRRMDP